MGSLRRGAGPGILRGSLTVPSGWAARLSEAQRRGRAGGEANGDGGVVGWEVLGRDDALEEGRGLLWASDAVPTAAGSEAAARQKSLCRRKS